MRPMVTHSRNEKKSNNNNNNNNNIKYKAQSQVT